MGKIFKRIGIVLGALIGLIIVAAGVLAVIGTSQLNRTYDIEPESITIPTDEASLARGEYLATALCMECHGENLSGELMFSDPGMATLYAPNLTPSEAGVGSFSDGDLVRAMRHAVSPEGTTYIIMPSNILINWSEEDLGATIAYLKTLEPSDNPTPDKTVGILGRVLLPTGALGDVFIASWLDHDTPFPEMPEIGPTAEYGAYFIGAGGCTMCHGTDMQGGPPPPDIPEIGEVPPAVQAGGWTREEFLTAVTTGVTPDDRQLDPERMPWELYNKFNQEDLEAVHAYLQTLLPE